MLIEKLHQISSMKWNGKWKLWKCLAAWVLVKEHGGEGQYHGSGKVQSEPGEEKNESDLQNLELKRILGVI